MTEKEIIEKIDLLFEKITDFNAFSINNIFFKEIKPNEKNKDEVKKILEIVNETKLFGMNNDLFEKYNDNGWFSLTEKGKTLKQSNFGFVKFTKKSKPKKFDLYIIVPIILTVVFSSLNIYQKYDYRELKSNYDSLCTYSNKLDFPIRSNLQNILGFIPHMISSSFLHRFLF